MSKKTEIKDLSIYERLAAIRKMVGAVKKSKRGFNYSYAPEDAILVEVKAAMEVYRVVLTQYITPGTYNIVPYNYVKTKRLKNGDVIEEPVNEFYVYGEMVFEWHSVDNPDDCIICPYVFTGQQSDVAQAFGAAMTYTNRYFLMKFLNIATPESDPDEWKMKKVEAENAEKASIAAVVVEDINELVNNYLNSITDKDAKNAEREAVAEIIKKYEKSGNYNKIAEPVTAQKLLDGLNHYIGGKTEHAE